MDTELYEALTALGRAGFLIHSYRLDQDNQPEAVAYVRNRYRCADVMILHGPTGAYAFRTPRGDGQDVLDPAEVLWDYAAEPVQTITALLTLPKPGQANAPTVMKPPQSELCLKPEERSPKLIIQARVPG